MALVFHPSRPVFPGEKPRSYEGDDPEPNGFFANPQTGLRVFMHYDALAGEWASVAADADHPYPSPSVASNSMRMLAGLYAGHPVYESESGSENDKWHIHFSVTHNAWVVSHGILREPRAWIDTLGVPHGDGWYEIAGFTPTAVGGSFATEPKGVWSERDPIAVTMRWPRWVWNAVASRGRLASARWPYGVHEAADGAQPRTLVVGCLRFRDNGGKYWTQSSDGESFHCPDRGLTLSYNTAADGWVTQNVFSQSETWFRAAGKPSRLSGATLSPRKIVDGEEVDDDSSAAIVLSFFDFVAGEDTQPFYMAEVALWR